MKTYSFMLLALSVLLFASCKSEGEMVPKVYTFTKENVMKTVPANWTKSVDIKLQTSDSVYFDCSSKMVLNDRDIFVSMYKKPIYHFDKKGQLLNKVGGIGHSKNEYSEVYDMKLNADTKELEVLTNGKIIRYDYDGNFRSADNLDIGIVSFLHDKDSYWLSSGVNTYYSEYEIFKADEHLVVKKKFLNRGLTIPCMSQSFANSPVKTYHFPFSNDIYHLDAENDTVTLAYTFKFPDMEIPDAFQHGTMEDLIHKDENHEIPDFTEKGCFLESERFIYLPVVEHKKWSGIRFNEGVHTGYHWIIDKKTDKEIVINIDDMYKNSESYHFRPQLLDENNILYFLGTDVESYKDESVHVIGIDLNKLFE